ncbi:MAG: Ig-like domain-containing protein, partial [bacterium]
GTYTATLTAPTTVGSATVTATLGGLAVTGSSAISFIIGPVTAGASTVSASPSSVVADGSTTSTITVTLKDANGNAVSGKTVSLAGASTISAASGPSDANGVVTFTVKSTTLGLVTYTATDITDNNLLIGQTGVTFITVKPNTVPVASAQSVWTNKGMAKAITLVGLDADGDPLTYIVVTNPAYGTLTGTAPNLTYTPTAGYSGADVFTFKVNDGKADSVPATVSITVNTPPVVTAQSVTTRQDAATAITLADTDADGDTLTYTVASQPAHGMLSGTAPNLTYTPAAGYTGADSFTFTVSDGKATIAAATVSITVKPNTVPVASAQNILTNKGVAKAITLQATDVDGDVLTYSVVTSPTHGTLTGKAPSLSYKSTTGYVGADSFTFKANDGLVDSNVATVNITVVNTPPVATAQTVIADESIAKNITLAGTDENGDPLTFSVVANPKKGILTGSVPNVTYTPALGYIGNDSFTFKVNDGMVDSAVATVSISVAPQLQFTASLVSPIGVGTPIKLTATSTSASTLEYKFRVKYVDPLGASVWATIQEYGDKNTATWKPAEARNYIVIAYARLKGSTVSYHAYRELVLTIKPAVTDIRVVINPAAPVVSGTPVRISATPVNGGTVEYRFKVKYKLPDGTYLWQTLQEYSPMRTCTWTPAEAHPYILYVYAREVGKTAVTYEVFKEIQYLVKAPVSALSLIASCPSPTGVGTPVKLTATATDGVTLEYKFYALYNNANNVQQTELIKDYASSNVVTWSPKLVTNYTSVVALAREKGKAVPFEQMAEITSYKVVAAVSNLALTALPRSTASIGSSIVLTTTATGGGTLEYMFKAKYTGVAGIVWFTLQDYGSLNTCMWTPTLAQGAHSYTIIAYAREKGTTPYKVYRELAYTVTP